MGYFAASLPMLRLFDDGLQFRQESTALVEDGIGVVWPRPEGERPVPAGHRAPTGLDSRTGGELSPGVDPGILRF